MTAARARCYDGRTSAAAEVSVGVDGVDRAARIVLVRGDGTRTEYPLREVELGPRVGSAPRTLVLPDGGHLEVLDGDAFDAALAAARAGRVERGVGRLERLWPVALASLALIAVGTWSFLTWGVPALATHALAVIPPAMDRKIGAGGLELLDAQVFEPSRLAPERREVLEAAFREIAAREPDGAEWRLEFRRGGAAGPNAFALPSGIVVMTDELVELAEHDDELRAVLAHEAGHLVHRHSMRMLVQNSAVALLMLGLLGDVSTASSLVAGVPTVLLQAGYSRDLEREADDYARAWMKSAGIDPARLADLLARLTEAQGGDGWSYVSSHPSLEERRANAAR